MAIKTINVSTAAQLRDALSKATGGETIVLASGNYANLSLTSRTDFDITHDVPVTIKSANPANPATLTGLDLRGAAGFTFENLKFDYVWKDGDRNTTSPFSVSGGRDIAFKGCVFDGDIARSGDVGDVGFPTGRALTVSKTVNFDFVDNTVFNFWKGVGIGTCDNVRFTGNEIHSMRSDGLNVGAPKGILIENNHFHDFIRSPLSGDHADMIQFASTNATRPATDVTIRGNLFDIGQGGNTQTIFMRNDQVDKGLAGPEMFFRNVLIEQNTIYNDHLHGISVGETVGLVIRNNALLHANGGAEGPTGAASLPRIGVAAASTDVTISNNLVIKAGAGLEAYSAPNPAWTVTNNLAVQDGNRSEPNHYSELFVSTSMDAGGQDGRGFLAVPGGLIETMGIGPDRILIDRTPDIVKPVFHVGVQPADDAFLAFDAANFSFGPQGALAAAGARFLWTFGDGNIAEGGVVSHRYAAPGNYAVKLEVVLPNGSKVSVTETVQKLGLDLLRFDSRTGDFVVSNGLTDAWVDIDNAALAPSGTRQALDLDVASKASIGPGRIEGLFEADNFALSMRLRADITPDSAGNVIRLQNVLSGGVNKEGNFSFTLKTDTGEATVTTSGVSLLDGRSHDIRILFDGDLGVLSISVDGRTPVTTTLTGNLPPQGSWPLTFGSPPIGQSFDGKLLSFDLDVDRSDYPVYAAPAPVVATGRFVAASVAEPVPPVLTLDDYVLDSAAIAGLQASALRGDTLQVQEDGRTVLSFDGTGDQVVLGLLPQFATSDRLAVSVEFQRDEADGSFGQLIRNSDQIVLAVEGDGFRLNVATADAGMKLYQLGNQGLNDTDWHKATVIVDTEADRLQVFVDDRLVLDDRSHDFVMTTAHSNNWVAGRSFDGMIAEIRIDDDISPLQNLSVGSDATAFV